MRSRVLGRTHGGSGHFFWVQDTKLSEVKRFTKYGQLKI